LMINGKYHPRILYYKYGLFFVSYANIYFKLNK
jgi:hypothetical protein